MNQFLQDHWIGILLFLVFIILILMVFIVLLLLTKKHTASLSDLSSIELSTKKSAIIESNHCIHHQEAPSVGSCLICEDVFCESCLVDHESMHFCLEHFRIFSSHKWKQITDLRTTPDTPEEGIYVYEFKRNLWLKKNIPSFVMTHYKINIENDYIESFIQLNVREDDAEKMILEIQKYKALD